MAKVQITKAQRSRIANALAHVIAEVFTVDLPYVAQGDNVYSKDSYRGECISVNTSAGIIETSVDVSPRLVSVFNHFPGPMTDARRGMAIRMSGNHYSGKINFHSGPSGKASDQWCEDVVRAYRVVAEAMLTDR